MIRPAAVLAGVAATAVLLAGCGTDEPVLRQAADAPSVTQSPSASSGTTTTPSEAPSASATSSPTASPTASPRATPSAAPATPATPVAGAIQLNGPDLGVTRLGAPYDQAVAAITTVLGAGTPVTDQVFCIGSEDTTQWGEFRAVSKDGKLSGWTISNDRLEAPSGVKVGTDVATLQRVYGDRFQRFGPNPDNGPTFSVTGVDFLGGLSSTGADATVTSLYTSTCSGP